METPNLFIERGKVLYVSHMGTDLDIVNDARQSFATMSTPLSVFHNQIPHSHSVYSANTLALVPKLRSDDARLIGFLARGCRSQQWDTAVDELMGSELSADRAQQLLHWAKRMPTHWTPFAHQVVKFRMAAPVPIRTQCFKHKIGLVENEESRRYITSQPEIFLPSYRLKPEQDIKQGSAGPHPDNELWQQEYRELAERCLDLYTRQLEAKICPEQARFCLPQGAVVNWVWTGSLYAFAEFYNKRHDRNHAQHEIADLADHIGEVMASLFPVSWKALTEWEFA